MSHPDGQNKTFRDTRDVEERFKIEERQCDTEGQHGESHADTPCRTVAEFTRDKSHLMNVPLSFPTRKRRGAKPNHRNCVLAPLPMLSEIGIWIVFYAIFGRLDRLPCHLPSCCARLLFQVWAKPPVLAITYSLVFKCGP